MPVTVASDAYSDRGRQAGRVLQGEWGFVPSPCSWVAAMASASRWLRGSKAGAAYASAGSFVVKSELGKASAEHTH